VQDIDADARRREVLVSIVRLGHSLGLSVTAEGVETDPEFQVIAQAGCDLVQGYFIAKPMDTPAFEVWQESRARRLEAHRIAESAAAA
jgi:EAL domain-containing protein (putative c-di-GMP-specific phosphodiesterase class I)